MSAPRRVILFVEGEGDRDAAPILVKKLFDEIGAWSHLYLDDAPFVVGHVAGLTKDNGKEWLRFLKAAQKKKNLGAVLVLLDGDEESIRNEKFCARKFAVRLADWARSVGAGKMFSVACVFARQEFESWLIACAEELAGKLLPDGREGIVAGTRPPPGDLDQSPRNAKGWLGKNIPRGYKEITDQELMTRLLIDHLESPRLQEMRSFRRLRKAVHELSEAIKIESHIATPFSPQA
jgi:hypothetical protein